MTGTIAPNHVQTEFVHHIELSRLVSLFQRLINLHKLFLFRHINASTQFILRVCFKIHNYEPSMQYFNEWWKQLFGESEGKDFKGIYPSECQLHN